MIELTEGTSNGAFSLSAIVALRFSHATKSADSSIPECMLMATCRSKEIEKKEEKRKEGRKGQLSVLADARTERTPHFRRRWSRKKRRDLCRDLRDL